MDVTLRLQKETGVSDSLKADIARSRKEHGKMLRLLFRGGNAGLGYGRLANVGSNLSKSRDARSKRFLQLLNVSHQPGDDGRPVGSVIAVERLGIRDNRDFVVVHSAPIQRGAEHLLNLRPLGKLSPWPLRVCGRGALRRSKFTVWMEASLFVDRSYEDGCEKAFVPEASG